MTALNTFFMITEPALQESKVGRYHGIKQFSEGDAVLPPDNKVFASAQRFSNESECLRVMSEFDTEVVGEQVEALVETLPLNEQRAVSDWWDGLSCHLFDEDDLVELHGVISQTTFNKLTTLTS